MIVLLTRAKLPELIFSRQVPKKRINKHPRTRSVPPKPVAGAHQHGARAGKSARSLACVTVDNAQDAG
jgi:hypothetical protein